MLCETDRPTCHLCAARRYGKKSFRPISWNRGFVIRTECKVQGMSFHAAFGTRILVINIYTSTQDNIRCRPSAPWCSETVERTGWHRDQEDQRGRRIEVNTEGNELQRTHWLQVSDQCMPGSESRVMRVTTELSYSQPPSAKHINIYLIHRRVLPRAVRVAVSIGNSVRRVWNLRLTLFTHRSCRNCHCEVVHRVRSNNNKQSSTPTPIRSLYFSRPTYRLAHLLAFIGLSHYITSHYEAWKYETRVFHNLSVSRL